MLFGEPGGEDVSGRLQDATLMAPALIDSELAHMCLKKLRRKFIETTDIPAIFAARRTIEIDCRIVDAEAVLKLAIAAGLSGYDASYLLIARQYDAELVTLSSKSNIPIIYFSIN